MPKASQKNAKPSIEPTHTHAPSPSISFTIPTLSSHVPTVHAAPIISTSTVTPPSKTTTSVPELPAKNNSKSTKVKETPRKYVKKVPEAATQGDTVAKVYMIQRESMSVTTDQVPHPTSKLDILVSAIDVARLDTLPPTSEKPPLELFSVEKGEGRKEPVQKEASDGLEFSWTKDEKDDEGENEEEVVNSHEEYDAKKITNGEEKSENKGVSRDEKESDTEDKTCEHANDSTEEENQSEGEEKYESEGEDQENISESERGDDESVEEEGNVSEESEVSSDEDDMPLSEVGKKSRKTTGKATKSAVSTRKRVVPHIRTPLIRSKRKVIDEQIMKESRSGKKPKKKVSIKEPIVEVSGEDGFDSTLPAKSSTPKKRGSKVTKSATSFARASRGKTIKNVPATVDRLTKFRNGKMLNGKILANTD
ncbi:uncharacterized protein [Nicotiana tomentosiformis]|uniref:uncharacterized protein n=1 Tax=Nicotiana tomentosiformis TaxID=4098 RepID=UPI00388C94B4